MTSTWPIPTSSADMKRHFPLASMALSWRRLRRLLSTRGREWEHQDVLADASCSQRTALWLTGHRWEVGSLVEPKRREGDY